MTDAGLTVAVKRPGRGEPRRDGRGVRGGEAVFEMFDTTDVEMVLALMQASEADSTENFTVESEGAPWAEATPQEQAQSSPRQRGRTRRVLSVGLLEHSSRQTRTIARDGDDAAMTATDQRSDRHPQSALSGRAALTGDLRALASVFRALAGEARLLFHDGDVVVAFRLFLRSRRLYGLPHLSVRLFDVSTYARLAACRPLSETAQSIAVCPPRDRRFRPASQ
ncbi:hypothetical protein GS892_15430 [Rhodococcus hoagii]|nr:hypothetical protein [Prescottella equi]